MRYEEAIEMMLNDRNCGFSNIFNSSAKYKEEIRAEISRAKCSIATAKVFLGFVEEKLKEGVVVKLDSTMLEAATFIGNGMGLDPTKTSDDIGNKESMELRAVANFRG